MKARYWRAFIYLIEPGGILLKTATKSIAGNYLKDRLKLGLQLHLYLPTISVS